MSEETIEQELTAENKGDVFAPYSDEYWLSAVGDRPRVSITVISASFNRIASFQKAAQGTNDQKLMRETCELIAESVVDRGHNPVWVGREVEKMATGNTLRFMEVQKAVLQHNGMTPDGKTIEQLTEDERKNF